MSNQKQRNRKVKEKTGNLCGYCGVRPAISVDHITADSRGGRSTYDNLIGSCWECQKLKGTKNLEEFRQYIYRFLTANLVRFNQRHLVSEIKDIKFYFEQIGIEVKPTKQPFSITFKYLWRKYIINSFLIIAIKQAWRKRKKSLDKDKGFPLQSIA